MINSSSDAGTCGLLSQGIWFKKRLNEIFNPNNRERQAQVRAEVEVHNPFNYVHNKLIRWYTFQFFWEGGYYNSFFTNFFIAHWEL